MRYPSDHPISPRAHTGCGPDVVAEHPAGLPYPVGFGTVGCHQLPRLLVRRGAMPVKDTSLKSRCSQHQYNFARTRTSRNQLTAFHEDRGTLAIPFCEGSTQNQDIENPATLKFHTLSGQRRASTNSEKILQRRTTIPTIGFPDEVHLGRRVRW